MEALDGETLPGPSSQLLPYAYIGTGQQEHIHLLSAPTLDILLMPPEGRHSYYTALIDAVIYNILFHAIWAIRTDCALRNPLNMGLVARAPLDWSMSSGIGISCMNSRFQTTV